MNKLTALALTTAVAACATTRTADERASGGVELTCESVQAELRELLREPRKGEPNNQCAKGEIKWTVASMNILCGGKPGEKETTAALSAEAQRLADECMNPYPWTPPSATDEQAAEFDGCQSAIVAAFKKLGRAAASCEFDELDREERDAAKACASSYVKSEDPELDAVLGQLDRVVRAVKETCKK